MPGTGTVTLLFTDLVGSTESLIALGEDRYDSVGAADAVFGALDGVVMCALLR